MKKQKAQKNVPKKGTSFKIKKTIQKKLKLKVKETINKNNKINVAGPNKFKIKLIIKTQQRFKSERLNVFTEEISKSALNSNDEKRMQSTDLIETYAHGINKDLAFKVRLSRLRNFFAKLNFSPSLFEKIPSFICLVFKIENE